MKSLILICISFMFFQVQSQPIEPPSVDIQRDDHVATISMDYNGYAGRGGQLWNVGTDGTDHCGYLIEWWPSPGAVPSISPIFKFHSDNSLATESNPYKMVTANKIAQIQPIANQSPYYLRISKLNGLGDILGSPTELMFMGGDDTRVQQLQSTMTFFDDFNLPEGPPNEMNWNNAMTPQTDPRFNLFFINSQYHVHTLNGTLNGAAGDKALVAQRARKPILIEVDTERTIVFDMDGIFSPRGIWYLDFNPVNSDLTGHLSFFDSDGDQGLPADVLRLRGQGHDLSINLINSMGESFKMGEIDLSEVGSAMAPNVRRWFELKLSSERIRVSVDGKLAIDIPFSPGAFGPGVYYPLWSTVGYNTSKDDNPYFLSHWDNFGFDGPDLLPAPTYNYVTRIVGTDMQKAYSASSTHPIFEIVVPDDILPKTAGSVNEVFLVFTYLKNDFSTFSLGTEDHLLFNGQSFSLPAPINNTSPHQPQLVNYAGSAISNRVKIGEAKFGLPSPINQGLNEIQFFAQNTGIVNVHLEIVAHAGSIDYTPPQDLHPFTYHHELPKPGIPAQITFIDDIAVSIDHSSVLTGPVVADTMDIEIMVGNKYWAAWGPHLLRMPAVSAEYWTTGITQGIQRVDLFLASKSSGQDSLIHIDSLITSRSAPAPQLRYLFKVDTKKFSNGSYELFLQTTDSQGRKSHPSYSGFGFKFDVSEQSGAYWPVEIEIANPVISRYIFDGAQGESWTEHGNWQQGHMPPLGYNGIIEIHEDCQVPAQYSVTLSEHATLIIKEGKVLRIE